MVADLGEVHAKISLKDIVVHYGSRIALRCDKLEARGKIIAVIGHNGAGKSTLLKTLLGLAPPHSGHQHMEYTKGAVTEKLSSKVNMAFCPEYGAVFEDIDVESYIKFWCRVKCSDGNFYKSALGSKYIDTLDLAPLLSRLGRELSKGERRRVQTAIGYLTRPRLFLFDEPFCGLDIYQARVLQNVFLDNVTDTALFISSHRMEIVERLADFIVVLDDGRVIAAGDKNTVVRSLCGCSLTVDNFSRGQVLSAALQEHFSGHYIYVGSNEIRIIGHDLVRREVQDLVSSIDGNGAVVKEDTPLLTDAMHFSLTKR